MVEGERERQDEPRHHLTLVDDRGQTGAPHPEDRHLRIVDDRGRAGAAERAGVRHREGPAPEVLDRRLALARPGHEPGQLDRQLAQRLLVDVADDRDHQAPLRVRRDPHVGRALVDRFRD